VAAAGKAECDGACSGEECCPAKKVALVCPVSGEAASETVWAAYNGGKVYLRCGGCKAKFEKDSKKYAVKANHQLFLTGQVTQKACPLTGKPVKSDKKVAVAGVELACCGDGCKARLSKAGAEKQLDVCFNDKAFHKAFAIKKEEQSEHPDKHDHREHYKD
jgi:hypothetical protein